MILAVIIGTIALISLSVFIYFKTAPQLGGEVGKERQEKYTSLQHYKSGKFMNIMSTDMTTPPMSVMFDFMTQGSSKDPKMTLPSNQFSSKEETSDSLASITWFGHSSVLINIDDKNVLIDPVFGERASMFSFLGPKRYDYTRHVTVNDMPKIDAVLISHDHYDHLDYDTFKQLKDKVAKFYVPLGVGVHLEKWGIPKEQINELDWWEEIQFNEQIKLAFTPSRHFSGRGLRDRFTTLWGSWVIDGSKQRLYFGGDSGYSDEFKKIGDKYGPFDFAMLECGQYNQYWANIHMMPEETAQAGEDLKAKNVMPIHWGKFTLSMHDWREPVQRFVKASKKYEYNVIVPELNGTVEVKDTTSVSEWWMEK